MDTIYKNMQDDTEAVPERVPREGEQSQIKSFYAGQTILLTGCTGFIGKSLVEKLLRTCTDLKRVYAIIRPKQGKTLEERVKTYFQHVVFTRVRAENPNFAEKFVAIEGDLVKEDLGFSAETRRMISENTDIIIHNAATTDFFADMATLLKINFLGTKRILDLASECKRLKCFVYVSTAFVYCPNPSFMEEKWHEPPIDLPMGETLVKLLDAGLKESTITFDQNKWWNGYTYSKSAGEGLTRSFAAKVPFPCLVYRPSVVVSAYKEPMRGWLATSGGANLLLVGYASGLLHANPWNPKAAVDVVPVDFTTNGLLASIWHVSTTTSEQRQCHLIHYTVTQMNPIEQEKYVYYIMSSTHQLPPKDIYWKPFFIFTTNIYTFYMVHILFHAIPCIIADIYTLLRGRKLTFTPKLLKILPYTKRVYQFITTHWTIEAKNILDVWGRMNSKDYEEFPCDLRTQLDWFDYMVYYWPGIRVYLLKDPMDTLPLARKKYRRLAVLHYTIVGTLSFLILYLIYSYIF